jgi:hypothetical protein
MRTIARETISKRGHERFPQNPEFRFRIAPPRRCQQIAEFEKVDFQSARVTTSIEIDGIRV